MYNLESHSYFSHIREDIIQNLGETKVHKLLEVGAGGCGTIVEIKKRGLANHVTAVELFSIPGSLQSSPLIDVFLKLDLNSQINQLVDNEYDVIIAADVLEHLINPWDAIKELTKKIKPGGKLIISLPNFRNIRTLSSVVIGGRFKYIDEGVLDKTHLRFFCKKDMEELISGSNLVIVKTFFSCDLRSRVLSVFPDILKELISYQIIHTAIKK